MSDVEIPALRLRQVRKEFVLHTQMGRRLNVLQGVDLEVRPGECLALVGPSGTGKSSLMRMIYGNYGATAGQIEIAHRGRLVDIASADDRTVLEVRRETLGYVSQFLRVIPRVSTLDLVAEPLEAAGRERAEALNLAARRLGRLNIPEALFDLAPATFSGGEQQRVNIARGMIADRPVMLLDEPTASLDRQNRDVVVALIREAMQRGTAIVGIFHDQDVRDQVATHLLDLSRYRDDDAAKDASAEQTSPEEAAA